MGLVNQHVIFTLDDQQYTLPLPNVERIIPAAYVTPLPESHRAAKMPALKLSEKRAIVPLSRSPIFSARTSRCPINCGRIGLDVRNAAGRRSQRQSATDPG